MVGKLVETMVYGTESADEIYGAKNNNEQTDRICCCQK